MDATKLGRGATGYAMPFVGTQADSGTEPHTISNQGTLSRKGSDTALAAGNGSEPGPHVPEFREKLYIQHAP